MKGEVSRRRGLCGFHGERVLLIVSSRLSPNNLMKFYHAHSQAFKRSLLDERCVSKTNRPASLTRLAGRVGSQVITTLLMREEYIPRPPAKLSAVCVSDFRPVTKLIAVLVCASGFFVVEVH